MPDDIKIVLPGDNPPNPPAKIEDPIDLGSVEFEGVSYKLDKDGNALNDKGEIFKSKADLESVNNESADEVEQVDIDGVIYTIDKDGNAVDENNAVKYTKDQLEKMSETTTSEFKVSDIIKSVALPIFDSEGNEVVYEDNDKGLTNYITDVKDSSYQEGIRDYQTSLLNKFPIIGDIITHLELHGNLKNFTETPDYSKVTITKDNIAQQESVVTQARILRGDTPQKAAEYVQYLKDGKRLEEEAVSELTYLNEYYNGIKTKTQNDLREKERQEQEQYDNYWGVTVKNNQIHPINKVGSVYDMVTKGKVTIDNETFTIPEKIKYTRDGQVKFATRQEFFNYLYIPLEFRTPNGTVTMTMYDYDNAIKQQSRTTAHDVLDAFKLFAGGDLSQLIKDKIANDKVKEIRKLKSGTSAVEKTPGKEGPVKIVFHNRS